MPDGTLTHTFVPLLHFQVSVFHIWAVSGMAKTPQCCGPSPIPPRGPLLLRLSRLVHGGICWWEGAARRAVQTRCGTILSCPCVIPQRPSSALLSSYQTSLLSLQVNMWPPGSRTRWRGWALTLKTPGGYQTSTASSGKNRFSCRIRDLPLCWFSSLWVWIGSVFCFHCLVCVCVCVLGVYCLCMY